MYNLKIENFQSISKGELPIKDFTVLVGKTNRGKSAILRALRTVLLNEWNSGFIKSGTKETKVEFEICEKTEYLKSILPALDIEKIKVSKPSNEYEIQLNTGEIQKFPKVGKNTPERMEALNLSGITTEREDLFNLNFQSQLEPLFLITSTEVELTSFINKVFDISRFEKALRDMKTDDIRIAKTIEGNEERSKLLTQEKERMCSAQKELQESCDKLNFRVQSVEYVDNELQQARQDLHKCILLEEAIGELQKEKEFLALQKQHLEALNILFTSLENYVDLRSKQEEISRRKKDISIVKETLCPCSILQQEYETVYSSVERATEISLFRQEINSIKKNQDICVLADLVLKKENIVSSGLTLLQDCQKALLDINNEEKAVKQSKDVKQKADLQFSFFELFKEEVLKSLKICPVCEQLIQS